MTSFARRLSAIGGLVLGAVTVLTGCQRTAFDPAPSDDISQKNLLRYFAPLTAYTVPTAGPMATRINLGREFYYDAHFSVNDSISCNSCHQLSRYGVDGNPTSPGHDGHHGGRNAPTVYNAGLEFVQFWDGRARDLADQASGPMLNPVEMGMPNATSVVKYVQSQPYYVGQMKQAFPDSKDPVTIDNVKYAIAAFEAGLITPSPWDDYLNGNNNALTDEQKEGLRLFLRSGCNTCHAGRSVGGNSYEQLGATEPWASRTDDHGRFAITKNKRDALFFKVPMLRNIAKTGPYFHDGSVQTLEEAVRLMGKYETGNNFSNEQIQQIVAFLNALTGQLPTEYIQPPNLKLSPQDQALALTPATTPKGGK